MKLTPLLLIMAEVSLSSAKKKSGGKKKKLKAEKISGRTDKMINCRFWGDTRTENSGELVGKPGEVLSSQCWPIKTTCEHGIEISFGARNFKDECVTPKKPEMAVLAHYDNEYQQSSINFCDEKLPPDSNAYGDWIYLNGTQNVLIEYQADTFDYEGNFRVKWQCFGMASSVWRRYIGNGWETIIEEQQDMQERFKIKLHRIVTKLMLQVTMKDKCLSEPSLQVLKRIESSKDIEQWVQNLIRLIKQRFSTCKPALAEDDDSKAIRHMEFKKSQAENLKAKALILTEKFEKFSSAPSQNLIDTRRVRQALPPIERKRFRKRMKQQAIASGAAQ